MKKALFVAVGLLLVVAVTPALAGEKYLGRITIYDAGARHNYSPVLLADAGYAISEDFSIPCGRLLTVQCDGGAYVCEGSAACTSVTGLALPNGTALPTSSHIPVDVLGAGSGGSCTGRYYNGVDGGCYPDSKSNVCLITVFPQSGAALSCGVWQRYGDEMQ